MRNPFIVLLIIILPAMAGSAGTFAQHGQLLAPPPPEAILLGSEEEQHAFHLPQSGFSVSFHTPLPVEEVVAFYTGQVGPLQELESGRHYKAHLLEVTVTQLGVLKVYDIPREPGVVVQDIRLMSSRHCASPHFRPFRDMYSALEQYSYNDFRALCERYGHLDHAYFGLTEKRAYDGRPLTRDQALYRDYVQKLDEGRAQEVNIQEMMEEAQRLMAQGKMEEATALLEQMAAAQQQALGRDITQMTERRQVEDRWDDWLGFLKELETLMYPTIVHIDYHPDHWPGDEWLRESLEW